MYIRFWGTRGSIPTPGGYTVRYGGNTPCIEIRSDAGDLLIIDAGTGIRELGNHLMTTGETVHAHLLISHTHWDHIHGFPFFTPAFIPSNSFTICGPVNFDEKLEDIMSRQMEYAYFPVKLTDMHSKRSFVELKEGVFNVNNIEVQAQYLNHPILTVGYRITCDGKTLVYCSDHEPFYNQFGGDEDSDADAGEEGLDDYIQQMNDRVSDFCRGANLVIYDAQYTDEEYLSHKGWGHSTYNDACRTAIKAGAERLALFHHDPTRHDDVLDEIISGTVKKYKEEEKDCPDIFGACEGYEINL